MTNEIYAVNIWSKRFDLCYNNHINRLFIMFKILPGILLGIYLMLCPLRTQAAGEFSTGYAIIYSVSEDGSTDVNESIKLKNLTEKFFPSSFSVVLPGSGISGIEASDTQGSLEVQSKAENANTKLVVKFTNQQIIGLNKEYIFNLQFKDKNIAENLGRVRVVNIPKLTQGAQIEDSTFTLSVPTNFGDPDYISPVPKRVDESGGRINFLFDEKTFSKSGISAIFGNELNFSFNLIYKIKNDSIFPKFIKAAFPSDSNFQQSFINSIEPKPENTETDSIGNNLGVFKLNPLGSLEVKVTGNIKTLLKGQKREFIDSLERKLYLSDTKFWDSSSPIIKNKVLEILESSKPQNIYEKAKEIDKFVSNFLQFDEQRRNGDFKRFGSVTALNNPGRALSSEFVDLEIALLRNAEIPARQVIGFSNPEESKQSLRSDDLKQSLRSDDLKPFSYTNQKLHTWVEFYDEERGWVTSDPAWENTTKGIDYFDFNDLTHIKLANSIASDGFVLPAEVEVNILESEINELKGAELDVKVDSKILSGFPSKAKIKINNLGNTSFPASELKIDTSKILVERLGSKPSQSVSIKTGRIPPFGNLEYEFNLKTGAIWHSYQDIFQVSFQGVPDTRVITVEPILTYRIFAVEIFGSLSIIFLFYVLIILIHGKSVKKS